MTFEDSAIIAETPQRRRIMFTILWKDKLSATEKMADCSALKAALHELTRRTVRSAPALHSPTWQGLQS